MSINILYGNLKPHLWETVTDGIHFVRHALEAAGVPVRVGTNQLDTKAINLFFDRFYEDPALPRQLKAGGVRYGLVCTELVGLDGSWNYGLAAESEPGTYAAFELAARTADFVWCFHEFSVAACRTMNPRTAYLPLGHLGAMATLADLPWPERDIDALLCGMPSSRRDALAADLGKQGVRMCYPSLPVPLAVRDSLMERSRLNLSVQKTDRHDVVSVTRICHSVVNRVPVLLETTDLENPYTKYCLVAPPGEVSAAVQHHLAHTDLEAWARARYDALRAELPMKAIMERVLTETVSL